MGAKRRQKARGAVVLPAPASPVRAGVLGTLRLLADRASTFQKIAAAVIAAISLVILSATTVSRYAPWAWAADVELRQRAIESKIDTLSAVVLQSQIADAENRIAALEAKARALTITPSEAEYLRAQRRRLDALDRQLQAIGKGTR